jgi:arylsulfatase A-like enzyme
MATLAELTGQSTGKTDGRSFLPTLLGINANQAIHPYLFFEFSEKAGQMAIRMGPWKGVRSQLKQVPYAPWELYHLDNDPSESNNIAAEHPEIIRQLEAIRSTARKKAHLLDWELKGY